MITQNISLDGLFIGDVLNSNIENKTVNVYISKLMSGNPSDKETNNVKEDQIKIIGYDKYSRNIKSKNYITCRPFDIDTSLPDTGSKVFIYFVDGNINYPLWIKFNPDGEYINKIAENNEIFKVSLGEKELGINKGDIVEFNLTSDKAISERKDGVKEIGLGYKSGLSFSKSKPIDKTAKLWFDTDRNAFYKIKNDNLYELIDEEKFKGIESALRDSLKTIIFVNEFPDSVEQYPEGTIFIRSDKTGYTFYNEISSEITSTEFDGYVYFKPNNQLIKITERGSEIITGAKVVTYEYYEATTSDNEIKKAKVPSKILKDIRYTSKKEENLFGSLNIGPFKFILEYDNNSNSLNGSVIFTKDIPNGKEIDGITVYQEYKKFNLSFIEEINETENKTEN